MFKNVYQNLTCKLNKCPNKHIFEYCQYIVIYIIFGQFLFKMWQQERNEFKQLDKILVELDK